MTGPYSKFARVEDLASTEFRDLNREFEEIALRLQLADHGDVNRERYPWSQGMLRQPEIYAARLWEYPYAILAADLQRGMAVADIGCGMTPFTVYLKERAGCEVTGVDPDLFEAGERYKGHGVNQAFQEKSGLKIVGGFMEELPLETGSQDRVFSISVMEHVKPEIRRRGIQEMARVLKPGGRAVLTVDMSLRVEFNRPLDLVWDSGLSLVEPIDLRWPPRRFGRYPWGPADVLGMTLVKDQYPLDTEYRINGEAVPAVPSYQWPGLVWRDDPRPRWRQFAGRCYHRLKTIVRTLKGVR